MVLSPTGFAQAGHMAKLNTQAPGMLIITIELYQALQIMYTMKWIDKQVSCVPIQELSLPLLAAALAAKCWLSHSNSSSAMMTNLRGGFGV